MNEDRNLQLLKEKIAFIDELLKEVDFNRLRQWREETLMILNNLIGEDSKHYKTFEKISYRSAVIRMMNPEWNRQADIEACMRGLEEARSTLNAIVYGVEQSLI
ncbi:hypothetical protein HYW42_00775 [Candidatus Daviesbacteria bacterium]|nr:hypothetical protein [Candidatus Daviesbacteria bacterium]